jgi:hypothetical protein
MNSVSYLEGVGQGDAASRGLRAQRQRCNQRVLQRITLRSREACSG